MIFVFNTTTDLYLTSRQPLPSLMSATSLMPSLKHNRTSQFIEEFTPPTPVKDKTSQLETYSVSTLLELTTSLANIKQYNTSFISKTNTALPATMIPVPMVSTRVTRLTPVIEQQTTTLNMSLSKRHFHTKRLTYNDSGFITPSRFASVRTKEIQSPVTNSHPFISVHSVQAKTTGTITGLTADSATSLSSMSFTTTLYSKSVIQPTTAVQGI